MISKFILIEFLSIIHIVILFRAAMEVINYILKYILMTAKTMVRAPLLTRPSR